MPDIYLILDGQQKGPFSPDRVRQMVGERIATADTLAWYQGLAEWSTVSSVLASFPGAGGPPPPHIPVPPIAPKKRISGCLIAGIVVGALLVLLLPCCAGFALGPITNGIKKAKENAAMQTTRQIGLAMFSYATDHNGACPDGKTSTEVFQKLLDGKYVTDPSIFYLAMPGKVRATSPTLTADNVCFDVTSGVTADSPDDLPVVYSTGYVINFSQGAMVMPDVGGAQSPFPGIAVVYKDNHARFFTFPGATTTIQLLPQGSDLKGQTYQQLKP
jgi:hypothetical protein